MRFDLLRDFFITIICWAWFTLGFIGFFSWRYAAAGFFAREKEFSFQRLNSLFYRIFFRIVRFTARNHNWVIDEQAAAIRSAVIVCNHLSYLDPLLLIALYERHRTVVKTRFFRMPIFGWVLKNAGYIPATAEGRFARLWIDRMESMAGYLRSGGNLFIFPEGTRSRDGRIGPLNRGALKIARLCKAPVYVLLLSNTDKLFPPGKFLFHTGARNTISLKLIGHIEPDYRDRTPSVALLEQQVIKVYREQAEQS
jgi:1-acyl-sn-glycerol-3-phosphate acyltransferase